MKNKSRILLKAFLSFFIILFLSQNLFASSPPVLEYSFNVSLEDPLAYDFGSSIPLGGWKWNNAMIRILTNEESLCKYDSSSGKNYNSMEGNFENYGLLHEKSFFGLDQGIFSLYVICAYDNENSFSPELELNFYVNPLVSARISFLETPPLKGGSYKVMLTTSRSLSEVPEIKYSFNGVDYIPLPFSGSGQNWFSYLIIPGNLGNAVGSFSFKGTDLEGRIGTKISSGNVFLIDTLKPSTIQSIRSEGRKGEAFLEWYLEEDVLGFNIYRSESPTLDKSDFYRFVEKKSFLDAFVEKGKTYYYKISAVDDAGNIGDLSRTIEVTVLREDINPNEGGLSLSLIPRVESLLIELENIYSEMKSIESSFKNSENEKKEIVERLGIFQEIDRTFSNMNSIKNEIELFKTQNLNENELENKLSSSRIKLANLRKNFPENIFIQEERVIDEVFSEETIERLYLEIIPYALDNFDSRMIRKSSAIITERGISVKTRAININIQQMGGVDKDVFLLIREIGGTLNKTDSFIFLEVLPRGVVESISELSIKNKNYQTIKELVISFSADTKEISYFIEKEVELDSLEEILFGIVYLPPETKTSGTGITGFLVLEDLDEISMGVSLVVLLILIAVFYLGFIKLRNRSLKLVEEIIQKSNEARSFSSKGKKEESEKTYLEISEKYKSLPYSSKKKVYGTLEDLHKFLKDS
ncbi:hypothetical protein K0A97_02600 [Patescibacteria group bacterium]|nr:hypothetical protein [Patescibacteria group bacterium]